MCVGVFDIASVLLQWCVRFTHSTAISPHIPVIFFFFGLRFDVGYLTDVHTAHVWSAVHVCVRCITKHC